VKPLGPAALTDFSGTLQSRSTLDGPTQVLAQVSCRAPASARLSGFSPDADQYVNQAKEIEPAIDTHGDTGLPKAFPKELVDSLIDAAPQMYS
jgi:hypothetical protein